MIEIPEATAGRWAVRRFTVSPEEAQNERFRMFNPSTMGRGVPAGTYTRLCRDGYVVMSDTPDELRDLWELKYHAAGRVLLNGLGLGCALQIVLEKPEVTTVDVVEIDADVIKLIRPYIADERVVHYHADAFTIQWPKGTRWDCVWHDIWDNISTDNLPEMQRLHRRYGRRCTWQGSWARALCERSAGRG